MKYANWIFLGMGTFSFFVLMISGTCQTMTVAGDELRPASPWQHVGVVAGVGAIIAIFFGILGLLLLIAYRKEDIVRFLRTAREWVMRNRAGLISGTVTAGVPLLLLAWVFQHSWTGQAEYSQNVLLALTIFLSILSVAAGWIVGTDQSPVKLDWGLNKSGFRLHWRWCEEESVRAD